MLSKEKYKDEIVEIVTSDDNSSFAVNKHTKKLCGCHDIDCSGCLFGGCGNCIPKRNKWANSEVIEPIVLTQVEKIILENVDKQYKWIDRDSDNDLCLYGDCPEKDLKLCHRFIVFNDLFQFVKWEDDEPYNIGYILANCIIKED